MKSIVVISFFLMCIANSSTLAQRGCIASNIPFQMNGTMYTTYSSGGYFELYGAKYINPNATFCIKETGNNCVVRGLASYSGTEVTFGPYPCPIDSYVYLLFTCLVLYGVFKLKNIEKRINLVSNY